MVNVKEIDNFVTNDATHIVEMKPNKVVTCTTILVW